MRIYKTVFGALLLTTAVYTTLPVAVAADDPRSRTPGVVVDDTAITAKVKTALIGDPTTKAYKIDVDTRSGVVLLQGNVKSESERARAAQLANGVGGVQRVDNQLKVGS